MLTEGKNRWRNPYFHSHPMPNLFSLLLALILFGSLVLILATPAR
jgi:hypothetical protein